VKANVQRHLLALSLVTQMVLATLTPRYAQCPRGALGLTGASRFITSSMPSTRDESLASVESPRQSRLPTSSSGCSPPVYAHMS
jgi:hypothetical protein